jgi:HSP20 family protein
MAKRSKTRRTSQRARNSEKQHRQSEQRQSASGQQSENQMASQVQSMGSQVQSMASMARRPTVAILDEGMKAANAMRGAANANPFEPMERFIRAFMPWLNPWVAAMPTSPKLDVIDRDSSVLVRAEVPGVNKGKLEVEASDTSLTIKGEVKQEQTSGDERYRIAEISHGAFERTVSLPSEVDSTKAKATFRDGVVEVMLPKVDRSRPHNLKLG